MEGFLTKATLEFHVSTEAKAVTLIEEAKHDSTFEIKKQSIVKKEIKQKGEVIDEYYLVTLVLAFNDPKYPSNEVEVEFNKSGFSYEEEE